MQFYLIGNNSDLLKNPFKYNKTIVNGSQEKHSSMVLNTRLRARSQPGPLCPGDIEAATNGTLFLKTKFSFLERMTLKILIVAPRDVR